MVPALNLESLHGLDPRSGRSEEARYETGTYPNAVAVDSHGTVAAGTAAGGDWDAYLYRPGETTAYRTVALTTDYYRDLLDRGLARAPDGNRLFATRFPYSGEFILDIVTDIAKASSTITPSAPPANPAGTPVSVTGKLTSLVPFPKHRVVSVTRNGVELPVVEVSRDGTFTFRDTPPDWKTYPQYVVTYSGDAQHVPGIATVVVEFLDRPGNFEGAAHRGWYELAIVLSSHRLQGCTHHRSRRRMSDPSRANARAHAFRAASTCPRPATFAPHRISRSRTGRRSIRGSPGVAVSGCVHPRSAPSAPWQSKQSAAGQDGGGRP